MKLTQKDCEFLLRLRALTDSKDLQVELKTGRPSYLVLRGTYGEKIHRTFAMSRQGVRWRFWHLFNEMYVSAFETVLFVEKTFGPDLREHAIRISKERHALRQAALTATFQTADRLANATREEQDHDRTDQD